MLERSVLNNGLQVVSNRLVGRDSVGLAIWVRVGSRHEPKRLTGVSHFVEHMLFKGTQTRSTRKLKEEVEGVGGSMNAFTGEESTCYFVKIPREHLKPAFDVLQDMINHSIFKIDEYKRERTVILEEIKMYLDQPSQHMHELMSELLWPNQPLGRPIAGSAETISQMRRSDVVNHVRSYYHPKNLLVTACGDLDHDEILSLSELHFHDRKKRAVSTFKRSTTCVSPKSKRFHFLEKKTEQTHFVIGFHGLPRRDPDRYRLAVLNVILGGNMSSRLFEEVREQRGLAYEIRSGLSFFEGAGAVTISAGVEPKKAPFAVRVIMRELKRLKRELVSKQELRRAKEYFIGQMMLGLEDTLDNVLWCGERILYGGTVPSVEEVKREIDRVSEQDVKRLANEVLKERGIHLALIGPMDKQYRKKMLAEL